jgi:hypothetical protein
LPWASQRSGAATWLRTVPLRVEDWLLAGWVSLAAPILANFQPVSGPFDPGQPLEGALRLIAGLGALACLAARAPKPYGPNSDDPPPMDYSAVGPFVGGFILITFAGAAALNPPAWGPVVLIVIGIGTVVAMRTLVPPLSIGARRTLITPFVLVTGGLFWSVIHTVVAPAPGGTFNAAALLRPENLAGLWFVVVFGAIFYAMLIYAPRQVAEPEGGLREWLVRYAVFLVCLLVGLAGSLVF